MTITVTTQTTAELVQQIRDNGGIAAIAIDGATWLLATTDQSDPWDPALRVPASPLSASNELASSSDTASDRGRPGHDTEGRNR